MEEFLKNLDYQNVGASILELVTFLVVVIVVIAILDRWGPQKPPMPPSDSAKPESDPDSESEMSKDDSSISLQSEDPLAESKVSLDSEQEDKLSPPSM